MGTNQAEIIEEIDGDERQKRVNGTLGLPFLEVFKKRGATTKYCLLA